MQYIPTSKKNHYRLVQVICQKMDTIFSSTSFNTDNCIVFLEEKRLKLHMMLFLKTAE